MVIAALVKNKHLNVQIAYYYQKMTVFIFAAGVLKPFNSHYRFSGWQNHLCGRFDFGHGYVRICAP